MGNFTQCLDFVLKWEGGYTDDPSDYETKYGISKKSYPGLDIKSLTKEDATKIYQRDYWDLIGCELLPDHMALVAFNAGVNCGVGRARKWLSICGGDYREFLRLQIAHYASIRSRLYLLGWINRTLDVWNEAKQIEKEA